MVNKEEFTEKLEVIMEYYGLNATAFAEELDFNRSTISHLLSGRNKPSLDFVIKLLQRFPEVKMSWLVFNKTNFPSTSEEVEKTTELKKTATSNSSKEKHLFAQEEKNIANQNSLSRSSDSKKVEKIVIFYSDGSFNSYQN